jgi:subtilisin family serine protease
VTESTTDVREYDPVLAEAARVGDGDDEISILARVSDVQALPPDVRVLTRFGEIVTLRARRSQIPELAENAAVLAMEAQTPLRPTWHEPAAALEVADDPALAYVRRPEGLTATGCGVVVGVVDWGCDFAHPAFRRADGSTRLLAIWDQRGSDGSGPGNRWGYGRILTAADIDRALASPRPYEALGYDPADSDPPEAGSGEPGGSHGTHVLDIAAGNGRGGGQVGVAPEADLVFVHLAGTPDVLGRRNLGDSGSVLEALDCVFQTAGDRPCVVNMSVGAHGGPHDGTTLVEQGIDRALWLASGRAVVNSAGNYFSTDAHAQGRLRAGGEALLRVTVPADDPTPSELEIWYAGADRFEVTVIGPDGTELASVKTGADAALVIAGREVGHVYHVRQAENREHQVELFLRPRAPGGEWTIRLRGEVVDDGRYHAWIERDRGPSPRFASATAVATSTTGTLCNGRFSIAVGAYDPHDPGRHLGRFSSAGPTRDGRIKPELCAPGVSIRAARSTPAGREPEGRYAVKNGTSMAAPHVAGAIALMFEAAAQPLDISDVRVLLLSTAERAEPTSSADLHRFGNGYLDIVAAERAAADWGRVRSAAPGSLTPSDSLEALVMNESGFEATYAEDVPPPSATEDDTLWQAVSMLGAIQRPEQLLSLAFSSAGVGPEDDMVTIASPALPLVEPVQRGDVLVRSVPLSLRNIHSAIVLSGAESAESLRARGVPVECAGGGTYVQVMEVPPGGGPPRVVGRRLTDPWGRVLRDEAILRPTRPWVATETAPDPYAAEQPAPRIDWCRLRRTIVANARAEEARWTSPTGTKLVESAASQRPFLVSYWMTVPGLTTAAAAGARAAISAAGVDPIGYWSAAFICFIMHASGVRAAHGFDFAGAHIRYIVGALRNRERSDRSRPFWLVDAVEVRAEATPEPGDLICLNRRNEAGVWSTHTFQNLRDRYVTASPTAVAEGRSHCALVLGTVERGGRRFLETIGGNEENTVLLDSTIPIEANGGISEATARDRHLFGMIRIVGCDR